MRWLIGLPILVATVALAVGAISGRVKVRSCCAPADPAHDLRIRVRGETGTPGRVR